MEKFCKSSTKEQMFKGSFHVSVSAIIRPCFLELLTELSIQFERKKIVMAVLGKCLCVENKKKIHKYTKSLRVTCRGICWVGRKGLRQ